MKVELTYGSGTLKVEAVVEDAVARPHELMEMCERLVVRACRLHHGKDPDEGQEPDGVYDDPGVQLLLRGIHLDCGTPLEIEDAMDEGSWPDWVVEAIRAVAELRDLAASATTEHGVEVDAVAGARDWLRAAIDGPDTEEGYRSNVDLPSLPDWVAPMVSGITELRLRKGELVAAAEHITAVVCDGQGLPGAEHVDQIPHWASMATKCIARLRGELGAAKSELGALNAAPN